MSKRRSDGFTLMEMLIVVAIIIILLAIGIPAVNSSLEKSKLAACRSNRRSLLSVAYSDYLVESYDSPEEAFDDIYNDEDEKKYVCPNGGTFTWVDDSDGKSHLSCSYHDGRGGGDTPGGGDEPGSPTYPGTDITLEDDGYWPTDEDYKDNENGNVTVKAGGIFKYSDGNYYVVTRDTSMTKSQAASGPGGDVYGWYATQKITGRIVTYSSDSEQKSDLSRGDLCQVGDDYYVFKDGGTWGYSPTVSPGQWYKLP